MTYGVGCGVSHSHVGLQSSIISCEADAGLLSTYSMLSPASFSGMTSFKKHVLDCCQGFVPGSSIHHQYLAFTNVTQKRFSKIDALRDCRTSLPPMVVLYDANKKVLIVKIMPSIHHGTAARVFERHLHTKFLRLDIQKYIKPVGSGRFGDLNGQSKEADNAYRPRGRRSGAFPSFVVEVGISKSLLMLQSDASFWLTQSNGETQIVILLHIDLVGKKIIIQHWECVDNGCPHCSNVNYPSVIGMIQSLELVHGEQYVGAALDIPAGKVLDTVPNNLRDGEFRFTSTDLQAFSDDFWED